MFHIYAAKSVQVGGSLASIQELKNDNKSRDGPQGGPLKGNDRVMKKIADTESNWSWLEKVYQRWQRLSLLTAHFRPHELYSQYV